MRDERSRRSDNRGRDDDKRDPAPPAPGVRPRLRDKRLASKRLASKSFLSKRLRSKRLPSERLPRERLRVCRRWCVRWSLLIGRGHP